MADKKTDPNKPNKYAALDEFIVKNWPRAKKDMEKGFEEAKKAIQKGEQQLAQLTEQSVQNVRKMSLNLKKEKLYHDIGKIIANTKTVTWADDKNIAKLLKEVRQIDKTIRAQQSRTNKKKGSIKK